jgi:nitroreductase
VDAHLAIVSKREVREYSDRPVPDEILRKVLQAGRATGSSKNTQPWRFVVLEDEAHRRDLASAMMAPANLAGCAVGIAVVLLNERLRFDAGRVAQNMMVAAWAEGVGSCPSSVRPDQQDRVRADLRLPPDAVVATILTLGYPAPGAVHPPRPDADPEKILARIDRLPLEQIVHRERFTDVASRSKPETA